MMLQLHAMNGCSITSYSRQVERMPPVKCGEGAVPRHSSLVFLEVNATFRFLGKRALVIRFGRLVNAVTQ